jgi:hypothetical protein
LALIAMVAHPSPSIKTGGAWHRIPYFDAFF